jgi:iron(III) transport system substrate-binding protein
MLGPSPPASPRLTARIQNNHFRRPEHEWRDGLHRGQNDSDSSPAIFANGGRWRRLNADAGLRPGAPGLPELSGYSPAEREKYLTEGARKEKSLTLYTSMAQTDIPTLSGAFEKKYGVKIQVWRSSSDKVVQRTLAEMAAKRFEVDVVHIGTAQLEALYVEKALQPVNSPMFKELLNGSVPAHRGWVATRLTLFVQAYNTNLIRKEDLPKTWYEFADPKWKGKLGIDHTDDEWFYTMVQNLGEEKGMKLFRQIVATNGLSVRNGHSLMANMVVSGEVPMGLTIYNYMAESLKKKGAPIDWVVLSPAIARANGAGIARNAPHPHAALLFYDYMLSMEMQRLLTSMDYLPTNVNIDSPLKNLKVELSGTTLTPEQMEKWTRIYHEVIAVNTR